MFRNVPCSGIILGLSLTHFRWFRYPYVIIKSGRRILRLGIYTGKLPNEVSQYNDTKRVRENKRVLQLKYLAEVLLMWF